eukprot:2330305-Pleurochrysis_carterae.AAC.1
MLRVRERVRVRACASVRECAQREQREVTRAWTQATHAIRVLPDRPFISLRRRSGIKAHCVTA